MNSDKGRYGTTLVLRVLLANLSNVIAEMLQQAFQQQPDIQVLNNVNGWEAIEASLAETDVLVLGVNDVYCLPSPCFRFLNNHLNLKILLLATTDDDAIVYWRALHCHPMQITSSQSLLDSIRQLCSLSPL